MIFLPFYRGNAFPTMWQSHETDAEDEMGKASDLRWTDADQSIHAVVET